MDRARSKATATRIRRGVLIAAGVLALISGGITLANIDFNTHRIDREKLSIELVQRGTMEVRVTASGQLLSKDIEQLAAQVPGRVAKKNIRPGAFVNVGQVLVELTNPEVTAGAETAELDWDGAVAALQSEQATLENNILSQEVAVTRVKLDLEKAQLRAKDDRVLAEAGVIPEIELQRAELDESQLLKAHAIESSQLQKLSDNVQAQLAVKKYSVTELAHALDRARTQAANLKVVAGINGIVQTIDVEFGQQLQPGSPIGRIARQDQLYAELKVPAREASQVQAGQKVTVDTRNGIVNGVVTRIDPGVTDGSVAVDADLQGPLPEGARPQLQVEGVIYVSRLPNTLYVGKPAYVKNNAAITVYKLDPAGNYAERVTIEAGKVSLNYVQVLKGLNAGDRIITSEIGAFQDQQRILLR